MSKVQRVNSGNRDTILDYIRNRFDEIASANKGKVGLASLWDVQFELQTVFNISDHQSQTLTWGLIPISELVASVPDGDDMNENENRNLHLGGNLEDTYSLLEDDHYKCNIDSDQDCRLHEEFNHAVIRRVTQAIDKAKGKGAA